MPKKTAQAIVESGNEYVLQVKANQPNLLKAINQTIANSKSIDSDYTLEKNKGRIEKRQTYVYGDLNDPIYEEWLGIKKIILIISSGMRNKKPYKEMRYYISNKCENRAKIYSTGIRNHWGIENGLHWVKDVVQHEDNGMIRDLDRAGNISVVRNMVMSIYRNSGYKSITYAFELFTNRIDHCINLINNIHILNI